MNNAVWVENVDLAATFAFAPSGLPGWSDTAESVYDFAPIPGAYATAVGPLVTSSVRPLQITGRIVGATAAARREELRRIVAHCSGGPKRIRFGDATDQEITGYFWRATAGPRGPGLELAAALDTLITLAFDCPEPWFRDRVDTVVSLSATPAAIPTGTTPAGGVLLVVGAATTPVITLRDSSGGTVATLALATLSGGEWVAIDTERGTVTTSLTVAPWSLVTSGDVTSFRFGPELGVYRLAQWPTLAVSGLAGGSASYTYRRRFAT
jgi:hypothetical protein